MQVQRSIGLAIWSPVGELHSYLSCDLRNASKSSNSRPGNQRLSPSAWMVCSLEANVFNFGTTRTNLFYPTTLFPFRISSAQTLKHLTTRVHTIVQSGLTSEMERHAPRLRQGKPRLEQPPLSAIGKVRNSSTNSYGPKSLGTARGIATPYSTPNPTLFY
ncbi:hypothetical protein RRG08_036445 [Elysia crispata]|uniref:Uncharacterized protein n=1 Tax=Elysia crispata TaxID=231223 RepID=A0AAE0ZKH4_9GAST|nr:hypothetical protein RRG08_036445 [Elysia crispata]